MQVNLFKRNSLVIRNKGIEAHKEEDNKRPKRFTIPFHSYSTIEDCESKIKMELRRKENNFTRILLTKSSSLLSSNHLSLFSSVSSSVSLFDFSTFKFFSSYSFYSARTLLVFFFFTLQIIRFFVFSALLAFTCTLFFLSFFKT